MLAHTLVIVLTFIPIFLAIILHEYAHGYAALKLGDDTAKKFGRLSLNPLKHIDWFGTVLLPTLLYLSNVGFIFGWAKPVPVNFAKIETRKKFLIVASAGIVMNIFLALISSVLLYLTNYIPLSLLHCMLKVFFMNMIVYNIVLAVFNILPIPPMDGSKIFFGTIDKPWAAKYVSSDRIGLVCFLLVAFVLPLVGKVFDCDWNILGWYIVSASKFFISLLV